MRKYSISPDAMLDVRPDTKLCSICKTRKTKKEYGIAKRKLVGGGFTLHLRAACKECEIERVKIYRETLDSQQLSKYWKRAYDNRKRKIYHSDVELIPVAQLRDMAFLRIKEEYISWKKIAVGLGFRSDETTRAKRALGVEKNWSKGKYCYTEKISLQRAELICKILDIDPVQVGV